MYTNPTVTDFKTLFYRDFPYGTTREEVSNLDIQTAIDQTALFINQNLFCNQAQYSQGFLQLAAHNLVMNLRQSCQGLGAQYNWLQVGKSVDGISESFQIPQRISDNPEYAALSATPYGNRYLMQILPLLSGQMFTVFGRTHA